jgi:ATP-dependent Clp protease ATP-binding subunit ClpA
MTDRLNDDAGKVLEFALREALSLGSNHIGPEHILLGIVRQDENVAANALRDLGQDSQAIRNAIIARLSGRPRTVKAIDGLAVLRLDDGWHWIRSGLLDTTKDGRLKASIAEVELNGERCVLVRAEADLTPMSMSGSIRLTYEPVRSAL